jgi:hypothetical protein
MTIMRMVRIAILVLVAAAIAVAQDSEETCLNDGTHCGCRDDVETCSYWQSLGEWYVDGTFDFHSTILPYYLSTILPFYRWDCRFCIHLLIV